VTSSRITFIINKIHVAVLELIYADGETPDVCLQTSSLYVRPTKTTVITGAVDESVAIYRFAAMIFSVTKFAQN